MENMDLLERILAASMNENLRVDLLRHVVKSNIGTNKGIPILKDHTRTLNSDAIYSRMKAAAGGTGSSVARLLGISPQGFNNQKIRKAISGNSIIDFHIKTGVSVNWLIGSGSGSSTDYHDGTYTCDVNTSLAINHSSKKHLSLVEIYDQNSGNVELKWCLTKHHECHDDENFPIPGDFGALLSLIIRYKDEAGTPDRVKKGVKRHFQVRKVLAYILGDPKIIRQLDARAKNLTAEHISGQIERPGKTEFRLCSAKDECLDILCALANQNGLFMIQPSINTIAWDFLIGNGSVSPRAWVLGKLKESRNII